MADEIQIAAPSTTPLPIEPTAPATSAPVADPAIPVSSAPATTTEAAPAVPAADAASLLAAEPKTEVKSEEKPAEATKPAEVKPAEGEKKPEDIKRDDKSAEETAPVTYEPFKLPDAYKDDTDATETVNKFSGILGKLEGSKREHTDFQAFGQEATDFYINGVNGALAKQQEFYATLHQKNITDRIDAVRSDRQLGGENFEKTKSDMIEAVQAYGGSKEQILALRKDMQESGMGVAPSLVRLVANMKSALDRYTKEPVGSNLTGTKPDVQKRGTIATLYGS